MNICFGGCNFTRQSIKNIYVNGLWMKNWVRVLKGEGMVGVKVILGTNLKFFRKFEFIL